MTLSLPPVSPYFQSFWRDFMDEMRLVKDFYISVSRLLLYYQQATEAEQAELRDGLLHVALAERTGYKTAWAALKQIQNAKGHTALLIQAATLRMQQNASGYDAAAILADIIFILGKEAAEAAKEIILNYLFEYPTGPYWTQVVWVIQDAYPEAFISAWRRYFLSEPEENWRGTKLMTLFLPYPEAIDSIHAALEAFSPTVAVRFHAAIQQAKTEG